MPEEKKRYPIQGKVRLRKKSHLTKNAGRVENPKRNRKWGSILCTGGQGPAMRKKLVAFASRQKGEKNESFGEKLVQISWGRCSPGIGVGGGVSPPAEFEFNNANKYLLSQIRIDRNNKKLILMERDKRSFE